MQNRIDISGLNKAEVLAGLYNHATIQGMGFFGQLALGDKAGKPMTTEEATWEMSKSKTLRFDYLHGKVMKVDLSSDSFDPWLYDRDNGQGTAARVVANIRILKKDPKDVLKENTIKIMPLEHPVLLGKEKELKDKDFKKLRVEVDFNDKIVSMPVLRNDQRLVCAYNQFGMPGMAKMFECYTLEDMQYLFNSHCKGGSLSIDWYAMTDKVLEDKAVSTSTLSLRSM